MRLSRPWFHQRTACSSDFHLLGTTRNVALGEAVNSWKVLPVESDAGRLFLSHRCAPRNVTHPHLFFLKTHNG